MSEPRKDLSLSPDEREAARAYVLARVVQNGECWDWKLNKLHAGHGQAKWKGYPRKAHRLSYEAFVGPADGCVCHTCDRPCCVNPSHLFLGTKGDNNHDAFSKGRYALRAHVLMTREDESKAVELYAQGVGPTAIAVLLGQTRDRISGLLYRRGLSTRGRLKPTAKRQEVA